jgi:hypothetical protein
MSFFLGQAQVIPEPLRITPLLVAPVLAVLLTLLYWVWRVRVRHGFLNLAEITPVPDEVPRIIASSPDRLVQGTREVRIVPRVSMVRGVERAGKVTNR